MTDARFLLDSNICIYVLEGVGEGLRVRIEKCVPGELVTSSICYAEVMRGIPPGDTQRLGLAEEMFALFRVMPFDRKAALAYANIPFRRGSFDRLIAAHALSLGLVFVTNNPGDLVAIEGLSVENWAEG